MRNPEYTKDDQHRIVSRPNGLWRLERFAGRVSGENRRTIDPWHQLRREASYQTAKAQLKALDAVAGGHERAAA